MCDAEGDQSIESDSGTTLWAASSRLVLFTHFIIEWTVARLCTGGPWLKGLEEKGKTCNIT